MGAYYKVGEEMSHIILSDKPQDYNGFIAEAMETFSEEDIDCIAITARVKDGKVLTG